MGIEELVQNAKKEEGREEGVELTFEIYRLLDKGETVESISEKLGEPIDFIEKAKAKFNK